MGWPPSACRCISCGRRWRILYVKALCAQSVSPTSASRSCRICSHTLRLDQLWTRCSSTLSVRRSISLSGYSIIISYPWHMRHLDVWGWGTGMPSSIVSVIPTSSVSQRSILKHLHKYASLGGSQGGVVSFQRQVLPRTSRITLQPTSNWRITKSRKS